ncbi:hypothetical protein [Zophobihabitans entericus]|uniref:DUF3742 family protein n=1 Tax=Zophobihabitans entericus TaxID=1635327 RepID=A0A6G9IB38_9GAMM|nr:hypothetical protein [Zophobihabitans entericus]QIQ21448.1 hypothetical protein IPMB12_06985 [Zophobihabitans entericus]
MMNKTDTLLGLNIVKKLSISERLGRLCRKLWQQELRLAASLGMSTNLSKVILVLLNSAIILTALYFVYPLLILIAILLFVDWKNFGGLREPSFSTNGQFDDESDTIFDYEKDPRNQIGYDPLTYTHESDPRFDE